MPDIEKPILAITMGDPAGIGPEVVVKALSSDQIYRYCRPLVVGTRGVMEKTLKLTGSKLNLNTVSSPAETMGEYGKVDLLDLNNITERDYITGRVCQACGKASVDYILKAADLALAGQVGALVTAPINKEATRLAGYGELGHMELLARYTGVKDYATMLVSGPLRVVHLTTHYSLKEALNFVTRERILSRLRLTWQSFQSWRIKNPCIAVAALNPHGGEGGILGEEELREIVPAIREAQSMGIDARGPYPADTVFSRALKGEFSAVLAMYHDQGHIPIKVYGFEKSISIALGLPFIRTSVDHGTAFDIAGKGIASEQSLVEAIRAAARLSAGQRL